jgi:hypothetical protein
MRGGITDFDVGLGNRECNRMVKNPLEDSITWKMDPTKDKPKGDLF